MINMTITDHPDPRPAIREQVQAIAFDGRLVGYISEVPGKGIGVAMIVWIDEETKQEVADFVAQQYETIVCGVSCPPKPPPEKVADDQDKQPARQPSIFERWFG